MKKPIRIKPPRELTHTSAVRRLRLLANDSERSGFVLLHHDLREIADRLEKFDLKCKRRAAKAVRREEVSDAPMGAFASFP